MPAAKRSTASARSKTANKQEVYFDADRETKGTFRFKEAAEDGKRPVMGTIWLRKDVAEKLGVDNEDGAVKITIEADNS